MRACVPTERDDRSSSSSSYYPPSRTYHTHSMRYPCMHPSKNTTSLYSCNACTSPALGTRPPSRRGRACVRADELQPSRCQPSSSSPLSITRVVQVVGVTHSCATITSCLGSPPRRPTMQPVHGRANKLNTNHVRICTCRPNCCTQFHRQRPRDDFESPSCRESPLCRSTMEECEQNARHPFDRLPALFNS
jgi:hypothetical protein